MFKEFIEFELHAKTSFTRFTTYRRDGSRPTLAWLQKTENAYAFLREHISNGVSRPDNHKDLLRFVEKLLGVLIKFGPDDINHEELRKRYLDDIVRGLAASDSFVVCAKLLSGTSLYCTPQSVCSDCGYDCRFKKACSVIRKSLDGENLHEADLVSAASAVENLSALEHYVKVPEILLEQGEILESALETAIVGNKIKSVLLILKLIGNKYGTTHNGPSQWDQSPRQRILGSLKGAENQALHLGRHEIAKSLIDFQLKHVHRVPKAAACYLWKHIHWVMAKGSIEVYEHILSSIPNPMFIPEPCQDRLTIGFVSAC